MLYEATDDHARAALIDAMAEALSRGTAAPWWITARRDYWRRKAADALDAAKEHTTRVALERQKGTAPITRVNAAG